MKKHKITEKQIKEIYEATSINNQEQLKEWFPKVFEKQYKLNNWFIYLNEEDGQETLVFIRNDKTCYGFDSPNIWSETTNWTSPDLDWIERKATKEEVGQALINEAVKRGFKEGAKTKGLNNDNEISQIINGYSYKFEVDELRLNCKGNFFIKRLVYERGIWAEVIEEPKVKITIEEIEEKLGYEIEIINKK